MSIFIAILLGIVQGLTEFIPVSSSGHLELIQQIIGGRAGDFHLFIELINLGTVIALILYFRKRIWGILQDIFKKKNYKLAINVIITCIPAGLAGLLLGDFIETNGFFSSLYTVSIAMLVIGILMIASDKTPHMSKLKDENKLTKPRALYIGLAQVLALIPGVSRSGSTILAGRAVGLSAASATEYSFLVSIPLMLAVCAKSLVSSTTRTYLFTNLGPLLIANLFAFVFGMLALKLVMDYVKKQNSLRAFGFYRVILASIVLIYLLIQ
ncbi:undecaprenyl-diphosphate phosphatase [Candidatus Saccharibacteria bacterium]|nr:undecaprenyl-diphosphate phosphatase [Candidatus Saccharibacteria bacterium]